MTYDYKKALRERDEAKKVAQELERGWDLRDRAMRSHLTYHNGWNYVFGHSSYLVFRPSTNMYELHTHQTENHTISFKSLSLDKALEKADEIGALPNEKAMLSMTEEEYQPLRYDMGEKSEIVQARIPLLIPFSMPFPIDEEFRSIELSHGAHYGLLRLPKGG